MKTLLVVIATGNLYQRYAVDLIGSARKFFPEHDVMLFTDTRERFQTKFQVDVPHLGYPGSTLYRYHMLLAQQSVISEYEQIFYADADMRFLSLVPPNDIFSYGITATEHPGFVGQRGTPEIREISTAYCPQLRRYFCGGFNGGAVKPFLWMAEVIKSHIDTDAARGVTACWHDESHLNKYLFHQPPAKVLSVEYCWPDAPARIMQYKNEWRAIRGAPWVNSLVPKLLAIDKAGRE